MGTGRRGLEEKEKQKHNLYELSAKLFWLARRLLGPRVSLEAEGLIPNKMMKRAWGGDLLCREDRVV